jgi:hypothetical protein
MESSISYSNWKYIIPDSVYKIQLVTVMKSPIYGYGYKSVFLINDTYYLKRDTEDKKKLEKIFARDSLAKVYFNKAKQGDSQKVFGFIMIAGGAAVGYAISKSHRSRKQKIWKIPEHGLQCLLAFTHVIFSNKIVLRIPNNCVGKCLPASCFGK